MAEQAARFKCDTCGATFNDADSLAKHKEIHESGNEGKKDLEQGTEKPTVDPSLSNPGPSLPRA